MTVEELISDAFHAATGKLPTFAEGSSKWNNLLASANRYLRVWARTPGIDWNSLYDPAFNAGTVTATDSFDLDDSVRKISQQQGDVVRITPSGSTTTWTSYNVVNANRLRELSTGNYLAQIGRTIRFNNAFTSSSQEFGGTIYLPVYLYPEELVNASDDVVIDDPDWLVYVMAADFVRNDVTRQDLRADLISEANDRMERMREDNDSQVSEPLRIWNPTRHTTTSEDLAGYV